jgi:formylglycine-generating enzyme required for sulfatase activity
MFLLYATKRIEIMNVQRLISPWCSNAIAALFVAAGLQAFAQTPATLQVQVLAGHANLAIAADIGTAWSIQYANGLPSALNWLPLTNVTLTTSPMTVVDPVSAADGTRFYRAFSSPVPTNIVTTNLVWIAPGSFAMGSPLTEVDRGLDEVQHTVTLTQGFYIGKYLVTQGEFLTVMGINPSFFNGGVFGTDLGRPVEQVYWFSADTYCAQLTQNEQQAGRLPPGWAYRLPTEAEWEFACRAGTTTRFSYGDDPGYVELANYAWYAGSSTNSTQAIGKKIPNSWGLFDMHGNVFEWCQDWYGDYPTDPIIDPTGPATGSAKVFRGGAWDQAGQFCRSAGRYSSDPATRSRDIGFRIVLAPNP